MGLVVVPSAASAQVSIWLQRGVSGFGASGSISYNNQATVYGVDGGYSYQGFLDFDLGLYYVSVPNDKQIPGLEDLKTYVVAPGFQYHPLKQSKDIPISLSIGATFQKYFFQSDSLNNADATLDTWALTVNVAVYRFFRLGENTGVIPAASAVFTHGETTLTEPGFQDATGSSDDFGLGLGAYFAYIDDGGRIYGLVPSVTIGDHVTVALTFGVVWSKL